ncbi:hypothetical protein SODALDRAFT_7515 [Sodiomyces alkalinus F11]|uniref:Uncharacterized protein n=1 Tax=Sodiomyces alkalinus (strain CBS 110278 / VKM F-3762 / F11) TaxID=1314773 RepID=A0A3N2Q5P7_SODAK|nr:hypothetical protein SODALDRAFT_7515 [Sodiomyces alkalinus F11]ROT42104.1 hypothetical protein SODALDRAFT_7515 [Sodiomyces alkalinus F11]
MVPAVPRETQRAGWKRAAPPASIDSSLGWPRVRKDISDPTSDPDFDAPIRPSFPSSRKPRIVVLRAEIGGARARKTARQVFRGDSSDDENSDDDDSDDDDSDDDRGENNRDDNDDRRRPGRPGRPVFPGLPSRPSPPPPASPLSRPSLLPPPFQPPPPSPGLPSLSLAPTGSTLIQTIPSDTGGITVSIETPAPPAVEPSSSAIEPSLPVAESSSSVADSLSSVTEPSSSVTASSSPVFFSALPSNTNVPFSSPATAPTSPVLFSTLSPDTNIPSPSDSTASRSAVSFSSVTPGTNEPSSSPASSSGLWSTAIPAEQSRQGAMDVPTQHALIAIASIGTFISMGFIVWLLWRTVRKVHKKRRQDLEPEMHERRPSGDVGKGPQAASAEKKSWGQTWLHLEDSEAGEAGQILPVHQKPGRGALRVQTKFSGQGANTKPPQPSTTFAYRSPQAPVGTSPSTTGTTEPRSAVANASDVDVNWTFRSFATGPLYNHSETSRQAPDARALLDPASGQVNRVSELSSLSSGFGDVDIIVPGMSGLRPPPVVWQSRQQQSQKGGRLSWASRRSSQRTSQRNSQRETMYTEASEDSPPRYRTVNSWVKQQTSRVKRAQARPVPGVSAEAGNNGLPPEPRFSLMMPDGEVPRRPISHLTKP